MPGMIDRAGPDAAVAEAGARLPPGIVFPGAGSGACREPGIQDTLDFVEDAVRRIVAFERTDAALRELEAFLIEALCLVARDPALELAAQDLHSAATIIGDAANGGGAQTDRR